MLRSFLAPALAASLLLAACDQSPTGAPAASETDDYALVVFGEAGSALEGTMGRAPRGGPFDGSTAFHRLPADLALSAEQIAAIQALREAFRTAHADEILALRTIFEAARAAREAGATREEVHAILMEGRAAAVALRPYVHALRVAIRAELTDAQRAWLDANRRRPFAPRPMAGP